jgi:hypothetical protein
MERALVWVRAWRGCRHRLHVPRDDMTVKDKVHKVADFAHDLLHKDRTQLRIRMDHCDVTVLFRVRTGKRKVCFRDIELICAVMRNALDARLARSGHDGKHFALQFHSTWERVAQAQHTSYRRAKRHDALAVIVYASLAVTGFLFLLSGVVCMCGKGSAPSVLYWLTQKI